MDVSTVHVPSRLPAPVAAEAPAAGVDPAAELPGAAEAIATVAAGAPADPPTIAGDVAEPSETAAGTDWSKK
jgi:hypothetical protein